MSDDRIATVRTVEESEATGNVAAIFADIKQTKKIDFVPAIWRTIATNPMQLDLVWTNLKTLMHPEAVGRAHGLIPGPARSLLWPSQPPTAAPTASTLTLPPCANWALIRKRSAR